MCAMPALTVTVANLKGGSAKTTTAAYLAHAWAASGHRVLLVDADPQASALRWSETAEWTVPTIGLPVKTLHTRLPGIVPTTTSMVVIDTPPLDDPAGIVSSALRAADIAVITLAPSMVEFERLPDILAAIDDANTVRARPAAVAVLLNRVVARANSTGTFRSLIADTGQLVLDTVIPRREQFAQAFGAPITDVGPYRAAADEILTVGGHR